MHTLGLKLIINYTIGFDTISAVHNPHEETKFKQLMTACMVNGE